MSLSNRYPIFIDADVRMISGCRDSQQSADVGNVAEFGIPDPAGRSGGACTSTLLRILYDKKKKCDDISWTELLRRMRKELRRGRYSQIPQISSSRPFDHANRFNFADVGPGGTKRAIMIGINYVGQGEQVELSGCQNDVLNIKEYIMNVHGFEESNILVLMDDGRHIKPTKKNILKAYSDIVANSQAGDCVYSHFSGHGGSLPDDNGDEDDGFDETMIPVDFKRAGQIRDDLLLEKFVLPMAAGVNVFCLMDCCHSGTILDLPYVYTPGDEKENVVDTPCFCLGGVLSFLKRFK